MELLKTFRYIFLIVSLVVVGIDAGVPYRQPYVYEHQFCMDTVTGRQLYVGEVFTRPGQCIRIQCLGTLQLWEDSCLVPKLSKGDCRPVQPEEENLDYPRCCPMYECKTYQSHAGGRVEQTITYDHYGTVRKSHLTEVIVIRPQKGSPVNVEDPAAPSPRKYQV
ncbi:protein Vago [Drosophila bipectinata]|uniref:protein Vago n=1 Tax=Drosophila bipectinata TaxID=42026 RepID=UPI001C890FEE|nr:uncharacterized protein LOC108120532 [Drosophila bipectinata]